MQADKTEVKKIVLVGLPNTGKSQTFNNLTGKYNLVSNYPFTTVESMSSQCQINGQTYEITDTPGLHCLYMHSEEELSVRDKIFSQNPDVIIQCIDANRLKQSLTLTVNLLELGIPMVISLNAVDETSKKGVWIASSELSRLLGVHVTESVATSGLGIEDLKHAIITAKAGKVPVRYGDVLEQGIASIESKFPDDVLHKRNMAILLLLNDPYLLDSLRKTYGDQLVKRLSEQIETIRRQFKGNINWSINATRSNWIDGIIEKVVKRHHLLLNVSSQRYARLSRHPIYGIPILLSILAVMFYGVVNVANGLASWAHNTFWIPVEARVNHLVPPGFWNDFLIGDYGFLAFGLSNAILTVLPILSVFFILYNSLEDIGYIPNLCVLSKRICEKIGLSGNAILPITLGFGCKTMATLTTKSLRSKREKYISIYLIAFALPCAAQMGLNMNILGRMGVSAFLIAFFVLVFAEVAAGSILNKIMKKEAKHSYIQELPDIRFPNPKAVLKKTYYKLLWFMKEAFPVFIFAALALFAADKIGLLGAVKSLLSPIIIGFLGFPIEMVDVLILCMAKHEAAAALLIKLIQNGQINNVQCIVAVTLTTMFVPCLANMMAMIRELGPKLAVPMIITINTTAILIAGALNWALLKFY